MTEAGRFALVGTGYRATWFARVARWLPGRFTLTGAVSRSAVGARVATEGWRVPAYRDVAELLAAGRPDFVVVSVPWAAAVPAIDRLAAAGMPVLTETPPGADLDGLREVTRLAAGGARIQVAEQYPFQPLHAARIAITDAGLLGPVHQAALSVAHGYHAFALMRRHLGVTGDPATVRALRTEAPVQRPASRGGPRSTVDTVTEQRIHGLVDFGGRVGTYDFGDTQYWSLVQRHHVLLRGRDGELADETLHRVPEGAVDETTSVPLVRRSAGEGGDMAGQYLRGIAAGDRWWWRNPFPGARLFDDEVAVATVLELMARYARGGPAFYGAADGAQDHYLYLALQRAAESGETVRTGRQGWDDQLIRPADGGAPVPAPVIVDTGPDDVAHLRESATDNQVAR
jgi:predicted dehydrogenase